MQKPNLNWKTKINIHLTNPFQYAQLYNEHTKVTDFFLGKLSQIKHLKHFRPSSNNLSVCIQW